MEINAVRGMHDLFGDEMDRWQAVESRLRGIAASFSFKEIRTPVLEKVEVFSHTVGDETDIVEKQMYTVMNDTEKLVLRPEGTAAFIRAVVEHQLQQTGHPQRFYYYLPMFRHERPQKGRLRQFHQFGAEIINDPSPEADAEIIAVLDQVYRTFGIHEYEVRVNSVGCAAECRPAYKELLKEYIRPSLDSLCGECQKRYERSPMRILDCKKPNCQGVVQSAPRIVNHLCQDCSGHHSAFLTSLQLMGVKYVEDSNIVRGLDYYTRTAFEFTSNLLGAQSALGGGGRYDGISTRFGAKTFPGVGFALGMERLMIALEASNALKAEGQKPTFYFAPLGAEAYRKLFSLSFSLKRQGIPTVMSYEKDKGLKWLMKQADRHGARFTVILGDEELKQGKVALKDMQAGTQDTIELAQLEETLMRKAT